MFPFNKYYHDTRTKILNNIKDLRGESRVFLCVGGGGEGSKTLCLYNLCKYTFDIKVPKGGRVDLEQKTSLIAYEAMTSE